MRGSLYMCKSCNGFVPDKEFNFREMKCKKCAEEMKVKGRHLDEK